MNVNVECILYSLENMERRQKPLEAKNELGKRLEEMVNGRIVPLVAFNCLDFSWRPSDRRRYPQAVISSDPGTSICKFFQEDIDILILELEALGAVDLTVIVPDSEVLDERVFAYAQSREERIAVALDSHLGLKLALSNTTVSLWSDYCSAQGLKSPMDYTAENYQRIQQYPRLQKKVRDQARDSRKYFERNGIDVSQVKEEEFIDRTAWYLAMYMGEGQALSKSRAICLNLEDGRVPAWFQRGANNTLPILTPVDPKEFYSWRLTTKM